MTHRDDTSLRARLLAACDEDLAAAQTDYLHALEGYRTLPESELRRERDRAQALLTANRARLHQALSIRALLQGRAGPTP